MFHRFNSRRQGSYSLIQALHRRGRKLGEQFANFEQNIVGARGLQRKFEQALRRELRAALGVARNQVHQVLRIDRRIFHESNLQLAALAIDLRDAHALALEAQHVRLRAGRRWRRAAGRSGLPSRRELR